MEKRITKEDIKIEDLKRGDIFVFGSNLGGYHGSGGAKFALDNGLTEIGRGTGLFVRYREGIGSYAVPTKGMRIEVLPLDWIKYFVDVFIEDAKSHPNLRFFVTKVGCGLAGYTIDDIGPMFADAIDQENVWLPNEFITKIQNNENKTSESLSS